MLVKVVVLVITAFTTLAATVPTRRADLSASECVQNNHSVNCCQSVKSSSDPTTSQVLGLLGVVVQGVNVPVGLSCSPISVVGVGSGAECNPGKPVCCTDSKDKTAIGCTPVDLSR